MWIVRVYTTLPNGITEDRSMIFKDQLTAMQYKDCCEQGTPRYGTICKVKIKEK